MTNPYEAVFDGVAVLGHAGQPVSDIARQRIDGPIKAQDDAGIVSTHNLKKEVLFINYFFAYKPVVLVFSMRMLYFNTIS